MLEEIEKAYLELNEQIWRDSYETSYQQVVLRIKPGDFSYIMYADRYKIKHMTDNDSGDILYYAYLYGVKIPIILDNSLDEEINFIFQLRENYEASERRKLEKRFYTMFEKGE